MNIMRGLIVFLYAIGIFGTIESTKPDLFVLNLIMLGIVYLDFRFDNYE